MNEVIEVRAIEKEELIRRTFAKIAAGCGRRLKLMRKVVISGDDSWAVWSACGYSLKDTGVHLEIADEGVLARFNLVQTEMKYGW